METVLDLAGVPTWYAEHGAGKRERLGAVGARTPVVSGDDDVVALEHAIACTAASPTPSRPSSRARRTS